MSSDFGFGRGFDRYIELYDEVPPKQSLGHLKQCLGDGALRSELVRAASDGSDKNTKLRFDLFERQIQRGDDPFFGLVCSVESEEGDRITSL